MSSLILGLRRHRKASKRASSNGRGALQKYPENRKQSTQKIKTLGVTFRRYICRSISRYFPTVISNEGQLKTTANTVNR